MEHAAETTSEALARGLIFLRHERWEEANLALEAVCAAEPGWADAWAYLSGARLALGQPEAAITASERALELDRTGFAPQMKAGELRARLGDVGAAEKHFLAAVRAARPASADEVAAKRVLSMARTQLRRGIGHSAELPSMARWRRPIAALRGRWRRDEPGVVTG